MMLDIYLGPSLKLDTSFASFLLLSIDDPFFIMFPFSYIV